MKEFGVFKIANGFANVCVFEGTESECKAYAAAHPIPTDDKNGYIICPNPDNPPIRNVFVAMDNGESLLIYTRTLTNRECKELTEATTGNKVTDVYALRDDELQLYNIDGRVWADTPKKEAKAREILANKTGKPTR